MAAYAFEHRDADRITRAFDGHGNMLDADVTSGEKLEQLIARLFDNADAEYLHVHNAGRGCYVAQIVRA